MTAGERPTEGVGTDVTDPSKVGFEDAARRVVDRLGLRIDRLSPADDPSRIVASGDGLRVTIERDDGPVADAPSAVAAATRSPVVITRATGDTADDPAGDGWSVGRAGMRYRDLLPGRWGGAIIASHIEVCDGGPIPDQVHHHAISFQLIVAQRGWVDVVYEDQGAAFRLHEGDIVLQPPHIRHRVLASSAGARVVEVGAPAEHDTIFDHEMRLPNDVVDPDREWAGQRFVRHVGAGAPWEPSDHPGVQRRRTDVGASTGGLVDVSFLRGDDGALFESDGHHGELELLVVLSGDVVARLDGGEYALTEGDSVALPAGIAFEMQLDGPRTQLLDLSVAAD